MFLRNSGSESNAENSEDVAVLGLNFSVGFDNVLPFSNELAEFVSGDIHTVEVGHAVSALDIFNAELHFSPIEGEYKLVPKGH